MCLRFCPNKGLFPGEKVESQTVGPLRFDSGIWRDERGQDKLAVEVTNESAISVRGYLFTTTFFDPKSGTTIRRVSTKELEQGNLSEYLGPGLAWVADPRKFSYLPDGSLASYFPKMFKRKKNATPLDKLVRNRQVPGQPSLRTSTSSALFRTYLVGSG